MPQVQNARIDFFASCRAFGPLLMRSLAFGMPTLSGLQALARQTGVNQTNTTEES